MNNLSQFIIEKLRINKDTLTKEKEIKVLTDKYEKGDICLKITNKGIRSQERVTIDVIQIIEKTKTILRYKFLTNIGTDYSSAFIQMKPSDNNRINDYNYCFESGRTSTSIYIPHQDCRKILEKIKKDKKFDYFKTLHLGFPNTTDNKIPVMQCKTKHPNSFEDYEPISDENINKIESIINGKEED